MQAELGIEAHIGILVGIMLVSGLMGGIANCCRANRLPGRPNEVCRHLVFAISAAFIVPLFLKLIGSNLLIAESGLRYLEFSGFCLIAALSSTAFIEKISNRVITDLEETRKNISELEKNQRRHEQEFSEATDKLYALETRSNEQQETDARALKAVDTYLREPIIYQDSEQELPKLIQAASPFVREAVFEKASNVRHTAWRDQTHGLIERTVLIFESLLATENGAQNHRYLAQLGYALKDQDQPDLERSRDVLQTAMELMQNSHGKVSPFYLFIWAKCCIGLDRIDGAHGSMGLKECERLRHALTQCMGFQRLKSVIEQDSSINSWLKHYDLALGEFDAEPKSLPQPVLEGQLVESSPGGANPSCD